MVSALLALVACSREIPEAEKEALAGTDTEVMTKVVRHSDEVVSNSFLLKFAAIPTEEQIQALYWDGVESIEPYFPSMPGKEELEARFGLDRWYVVNLEEGSNLHRTIQKAAALTQVEVAEYKSILTMDKGEAIPYPETKGTVSPSFNDPMLVDQWNYNNQGNGSISGVKGADVNVKDVWSQLICGDPDIVVAVIDEGVKYTHPDLKDNMWMNTKEIPGNGIDDDKNGYIDDIYGFNFCSMTGDISWGKKNSKNPRLSDSGHGTHCAGTIAAVNNNGKGVSGIAGGSGNSDGCRIMTCQIFSGDETGPYNGDTAKAIKYAADNGASVISCSYGWGQAYASDNYFYKNVAGAEIDAIHYFEASCNNTVLDGNIAIFASGNEGMDHANYPGAFVDIVSVSSFGPDFLPAYYTNYGPGCNVAAPGGDYYKGGDKACILSTLTSEISGSDYGYMQGTSMACPHVSGVVALALSYAKQLGKKYTVQEFKQLIMASTKDIDKRISNAGADYAKYYHKVGTGAIDAWSLMMHIEGLPTLTAGIGKQQWIDLSSTFGTASTSLTYLSVEVPEAAASSMGLQKISATNTEKYPAIADSNGYAFIQYGRLYIHPTAIGSGVITIRMVGGGDHLGGGDNPPGGMEVTQKVSLIARDTDGGNGMGGWL